MKNPKKQLRRILYSIGYNPRDVDILLSRIGIRHTFMKGDTVVIQSREDPRIAGVNWIPA